MRVDIKGAVKHTGLSEYAIRKGVWAGRLPVYRVGSRGRMIFDTELLDAAIKADMLRNMEFEICEA